MQAGEPDSPDTRTPPILVVDDEEIILCALRETLCQARYEVVAISEPETALDELTQREFSVIVSDQKMPGLSGLDLLAKARHLSPRTTRVLITGLLNLDMVVEAINQGEIFRFILKPWLPEEFLATVQNSVQRYELLRENSHLQAATQAMNRQLAELNCSLEQQVKLVAQQNQQLAEMNQALEGNFLRSLEVSVHTMQTFYPSLGSEARRVSRFCQSMADVLRLTSEQRRILETSARLYDIGLVGVPRHIIRRWQQDPDGLDAAEEALIRQHPVLGQELAAFDRGLDKVGEIIRAHHERFDGTGYPDELEGENIPWLARLLTAAVAYVSSPLPNADALDAIKTGAGSVFDPEAVRVLLRTLPLAPLSREEKQVPLTALRPGMILACGVYNSSGMLLLPEGQHLNSTSIEKILNHNRVQAINPSLVVYG